MKFAAHDADVEKNCVFIIFKTFTKLVVLLLTWQFIGTTIYYMLLPFILVYNSKGASGVYISLVFSIINILSPVAGYLGDLKYTHFRLLKCGTIFTIAATGIFLSTCLSLIVVRYRIAVFLDTCHFCNCYIYTGIYNFYS